MSDNNVKPNLYLQKQGYYSRPAHQPNEEKHEKGRLKKKERCRGAPAPRLHQIRSATAERRPHVSCLNFTSCSLTSPELQVNDQQSPELRPHGGHN